MDLDRLQRRLTEQESEGKVTQLIDVVKKLIPAFEDLRTSVEHIPADQNDTPLAKGINIVYANITKVLEAMGISSVTSLGMDPDSELHEPMGLQPAASEDQKGKIISEFSRAYIYEKNGKRIVIQSAKVIIGE
jgi:molecular chaperone GrpE